ncbi:M48 family metallopeptidase [Mangrovivirga sp. M17]|uniref:M48 family metallopeptidase n=1 Tax=Mangrovivirga halotolerans TaxID=2993936 RepID=A0ABT3RSC6_9BACT|nr:M48 family metallopeptidase [Mangrovivirga halotolerans]MCX2744070.1 M48 family metallopeptidase [Mangrovivirga halotolerans]
MNFLNKLLLTNFLLLLVSFDSNSQSIEKLEAKGAIPSDLLELPSLTYQKELESISESDSRKVRKEKENFYFNSNFILFDYLTSGKVLFNDPVTNYLNEILTNLLKENHPELLNEIRLYAVKSPVPNAFTTNNGMIFFNIGLLEKLNNEAEIAFILAHEVIHYKNKHVIDGYLESKEIEKGSGDYKKLTVKDQFLTKAKYSRERELEADELGFDIFLNSDYNISDPQNVYDILLTADQITSKTEYDINSLSSSTFVLTDEYFPDEKDLKVFEVSENYEDKEATHPNIKKRKERILSKIENSNIPDQENLYIVGEEKFKQVKMLSHKELVRQYLLNHQYTEAIFKADEFGKLYRDIDSVASQKMFVKALYGLAINHEEMRIQSDLFSIDYQRLYKTLRNIETIDLGLLAISHLIDYEEKYGRDEEIRLLIEDILKNMVYNHTLIKNYITGKSKLIDSKVKLTVGRIHSTEYGEEILEDVKDYIAFMELSTKQKNELYKNNKYKVKNSLIINPFYAKLKGRNKKKLDFEASEDFLVSLSGYIDEAAEPLDFKATVIDVYNLDKNDLEKFNDQALINEWLNEKLNNEEWFGISPIYSEVQPLREKYNTDYFTWIGTLDFKGRMDSPSYGGIVLTALYSVPMSAILLVEKIRPHSKTFYFSITFDLKSGKIVNEDAVYLDLKCNEPLIKSKIHNTFFKLKYGK